MAEAAGEERPSRGELEGRFSLPVITTSSMDYQKLAGVRSVQVDGAEWQELREVEMEWKLQPGPNRLSVRAVNVFGREGRTSHAEIVCDR